MNILLSNYSEKEKTGILHVLVQKIDWFLFIIVTVLSILGIVLVYSATVNLGGNPFTYIGKQVAALFFGFILLVILMGINYEVYKTYYHYFYTISIILLFIVLLFGTVYRGTRAWLSLSYFSIQVTEITKLLFIVSLAGYLERQWRELYHLQKLVIPLFLLAGNVLLILLEKDFSGTLTYFPVFLVMLFFANVRVLHLAGITLFGSVTIGIPLLKTMLSINKHTFLLMLFQHQMYLVLIAAGVLIFLLWWLLKQLRIFIPLFYFICAFLIIIAGSFSSYLIDHSMKEYQKKRLIVFMSPSVDPLGSGYNIAQSRIAIGSGRILGKGILKGKQSQLGYVPEKHTDFIFSLMGEELGFSFSFTAIILYFILVWRSIEVAKTARDKYGSLVATGIATMFAFYSIVNIGMTMGLMPTTGLPLPFISYGGSNMVSSLAAIGILQSIYVRRYIY